MFVKVFCFLHTIVYLSFKIQQNQRSLLLQTLAGVLNCNFYSGKTTVLNKLRLRKTTHTLPTIGVNVDTVTPVKDLTVTIWDVGGQSKLRQLWKHYYSTTEGKLN